MKYLPLREGKQTIIDDSDFEWLNQWKWSLTGNGYVVRNAKVSRGLYTVQRLHRFIMEAPEEAAKAYNELAKEWHGEFARLNNV